MTNHAQKSPFPMRGLNGRHIVNEKCQCGAMRSDHNDTVAYGHGSCPAFSCEKFTWADFVFASKYQQAKLNRSTSR